MFFYHFLKLWDLSLLCLFPDYPIILVMRFCQWELTQHLLRAEIPPRSLLLDHQHQWLFSLIYMFFYHFLKLWDLSLLDHLEFNISRDLLCHLLLSLHTFPWFVFNQNESEKTKMLSLFVNHHHLDTFTLKGLIRKDK